MEVSDEYRELIRHLKVMPALNDEELNTLFGVLHAVPLAPGTHLFAEGDAGENCRCR